MHDFIYNVWFFTMDMMGMGEKKTRKTYIHEKQGKNHPFGFPPIPPSIKLEADCFPGRKIPETSWTYPRWGGIPATHTHTHTHIYIYIYTHTHAYIYIYIYIYIKHRLKVKGKEKRTRKDKNTPNTLENICDYEYVYTWVYIQVYKYTHAYTYKVHI